MASSGNPADNDRRFRTIMYAARFLRVSESTIYRLGHRGEIEMLKVGRSTRVTQASLDRFIENAKRLGRK